MIICQNPILVKSYGIELQKESTVASRRLRISATEPSHYGSISQEHPVAKRKVRPTFFPTTMDAAVNMITSVRMLASLPNQKYIDAMDLNIIRDDIMSMDPSNCSETQAILDDDDIMSALERADRQYKEGRAKSLRNLAKDLGFEVDALLD